MLGHDEVLELLPVFVLDAVDDDERTAVKHHVAECSACQEELASLESDLAAVDRSVEAPPALWAKVRDEFRRRFPG